MLLIRVMLVEVGARMVFRKKRKEAMNSLQNVKEGVPVVAQWLTNPTRNHEIAGSIPGLVQRCHELGCRSQTRLGSRIAVVLA